MENRTKKQILPYISTILICLLLCGCDEFYVRAEKPTLKNVIILISDGCGYNHVDAASLYQYGKKGVQPYEQFPVICAMSTYPSGGSYDPQKAWADFDYVKAGATDSAASATAISCGIKTYNGAICVGIDKKPLKNIIERCEELSKATGVITTVQFSHATPAGFSAHNESRNNYEEIAQEMILDRGFEVIMGCGHPYYDNDGKRTTRPNDYKYVGGLETYLSLLNGTAGGDADGDGKDDKWKIIENRKNFQKMASGKTPKRVFGLPMVNSTLQQKRSGNKKTDAFVEPFNETIPTLAEMTKAALNVLDNDRDGFFLMVEGGAVDWASHDNQSGRVIEEQIDFNKSVEVVIEWVEKNSSWDQTLVIVTGDHECGYMTGPGRPLQNKGINDQPQIQWNSDGHTNSLIPFYAKGFGSEQFIECQKNTDPVRGPYIDNTDIARVIFDLLAEQAQN